MAETTDGLHCAEALDGGFDAGEEFIESLARVDDVLYDEGGAAQDSQWSSSSRSWGRGDSPSCHPDASFTATSSSYGHSIPSLATSGTNATLWSGESSASHAPDSMRHATQVTAANGDAAAAHNTLTAGLGNSQTNWPASLPLWSGQSSAGHLPHATQLSAFTAANGGAAAAHNTLTAGLGNSQTNCPPTSSSHGRPIPSHATSATSATMPSGRTFDSFDWSLGEDDEERGSNQLQPARMPHRAAYQLSQHDSEHGVSLLAGLHSAQAPRQDTAAANEGAAAAANTSTAPPTASKTKLPNWYLRNKARAESNRQAGGEVGKYPWMKIGVRTTGHPRLDAGYIDPATGQKVKSGYARDLDALERNMYQESPHFLFFGKSTWVLVQEERLSDGTVLSTKFIQDVSREQMEGVRKGLQPGQLILLANSGPYLCENCWVGEGCGCGFVVSWSRRTCGHSVVASGAVQLSRVAGQTHTEYLDLGSLTIYSTFSHDCRPTRTMIPNELDESDSLLLAKVPVQLDESLAMLVPYCSAQQAYQHLQKHNVSMGRDRFYRWYEKEKRKSQLNGKSAHARLLDMQDAAEAKGTKFIINVGPSGHVECVIVQTKRMLKYLEGASCASIDGSHVNNDRGMILVTVKDAYDKLHPAAVSIFFGGESSKNMLALYEEAGLKGISQLRDDGSCYDANWLRRMSADAVLWFLCCWHFWFKTISHSIASWHPHQPKLWEKVCQLQLKIFPEGQDDPDVDTRVDTELRNLRALYTSDEARSAIGKLESQKTKLICAYRYQKYMDGLKTSAVPPRHRSFRRRWA